MATTPRDNPSISRLKNLAEETFLSPSEVNLLLTEISESLGVTNLGIEVTIKDVFHRWGQASTYLVLSETITAAFEIDMSICLAESVSDAASQRQMLQLLEALKAVWAKEFRNEHGGLTLKASGAGEIFKSSVRHLALSNDVQELSVVYIDLDHFGTVNNQISHEAGNFALRNVYAFMHELAQELNGLAFFDGGDEFIMVLPTIGERLIAFHLGKLREKIRNITFEKFNVKTATTVTVDMTAGVAVRTPQEICEKIASIKTDCEDLTKSDSAERMKKRGTINFERRDGGSGVQQKTISIEQFFKLGIVISKSRQALKDVFADDFLNLIAEHVETQTGQRPDRALITHSVSELTSWFGKTHTLPVNGVCDEGGLLVSQGSSEYISSYLIILAIAHGLSIAAAKGDWAAHEKGSRVSIIWREETGDASVVLGHEVLWGTQVLDDTVTTLDIGPFVRTVSEGDACGAVILVQIGFPDDPITVGGNIFPDDAFVAHVRVDARPVVNGGLPDFWQIALAQVVSAFSRVKGGAPVLVWGAAPENTQTYARLSGKSGWDVEDVGALTGLPSQQIKEIGDQLPSLVKIVSDPTRLLDEVYLAYQSASGVVNKGLLGLSGRSESLLPRAMAAGTPLRQSEGIVCETASIAYPIVIDTLRKSEDVRKPTDDSDQQLQELIAFKIKLTNPTQGMVPSYLAKQAKELEEYAERVLLSKSGVIRKYLEESNQCTVFVKHLSGYFRPAAKHRSTRRACLVVPHIVEEGADPRPLGLISVWATPRFTVEGKSLIDFVFVWRTVEAFIGLPYSLYGSIRMAEQLRSLIQTFNATEGLSAEIQLGELSYLALSIHLGSDEFHMRVAKHIVDAASD